MNLGDWLMDIATNPPLDLTPPPTDLPPLPMDCPLNISVSPLPLQVLDPANAQKKKRVCSNTTSIHLGHNL